MAHNPACSATSCRQVTNSLQRNRSRNESVTLQPRLLRWGVAPPHLSCCLHAGGSIFLANCIATGWGLDPMWLRHREPPAIRNICVGCCMGRESRVGNASSRRPWAQQNPHPILLSGRVPMEPEHSPRWLYRLQEVLDRGLRASAPGAVWGLRWEGDEEHVDGQLLAGHSEHTIWFDLITAPRGMFFHCCCSILQMETLRLRKVKGFFQGPRGWKGQSLNSG